MLASSPVIVVLIVGSLLLACFFAFCHAKISKKRRAKLIRNQLTLQEERINISNSHHIPFPFAQQLPGYQPPRVFTYDSESSKNTIRSHSSDIPITVRSTQKTVSKYEHVLKASTLRKAARRSKSHRSPGHRRYSTAPRSASSYQPKSSSSSVRGEFHARKASKSPGRAMTARQFRHFDYKPKCTEPRSIMKSEVPFTTAVSIPEENESCSQLSN